MKKIFIGPYQIGILLGASEALRIAATITEQPEVDLRSLFYATAFQAGVDEFLVAEIGCPSRICRKARYQYDGIKTPYCYI